MKYRLLDILACPICKKFPLRLIVFNENTYDYEVKLDKDIVCEEYCGLLGDFISKITPKNKINCVSCLKREVNEGILICDNCLRWYPIIEEIPHMLPDELRDKKSDISFLKKYRDKIPKEILENGKPWNLSSTNNNSK